jgi:general transcription factor 3C polypeptide 3 (transcription factor C subunit 4)
MKHDLKSSGPDALSNDMAPPQNEYPDPEISQIVGISWIGRQGSSQHDSIDGNLEEADSLQDKSGG